MQLLKEVRSLQMGMDVMVDEAIQADDYWRFQAVLQTLLSSGTGEEQVVRLRDAMQRQRRRNEASGSLRRAARARDVPKLRSAIEAALKVHLREPEVKAGREALRALEARNGAKQELLGALVKGGIADLQRAVAAAESAGLHLPAPALLGEDPEEGETLEAVRIELASRGLAQLQEALEAGDAQALAAAIDRAEELGVDKNNVAHFMVELSKWRVRDVHRQELRQALEAGCAAALQEALRAAEAAGLGDEEQDEGLVVSARASLRSAEERDRLRAAQARSRQELRRVTDSEDVRQVAAALADAEAAGLTGGEAEVSRARSRLRSLRSSAAAQQELRQASQAGDLYRLRAAIAAGRETGIPEKELHAAAEAVQALEARARARRDLELATSNGNPELLRRAMEEGRQVGLAKEELAQAAAKLHSVANSRSVQDLQEALAAGRQDLPRLRAAACAAADSGYTGPELDAAWQQVRSLESQDWARRQLQGAAEAGDPARLQAALRQAQQSGLTGPAVEAARGQLREWHARQHALLEHRLALASGDPEAIDRACRALADCGLPPCSAGAEEPSAAAAEASGGELSGGPALQREPSYEFQVPDTVPQYHPEVIQSSSRSGTRWTPPSSISATAPRAAGLLPALTKPAQSLGLGGKLDGSPQMQAGSNNAPALPEVEVEGPPTAPPSEPDQEAIIEVPPAEQATDKPKKKKKTVRFAV